jgi:phosphoribosylaminoimidazolecarboxamide formyltransferase/IMP cyclohydrolase
LYDSVIANWMSKSVGSHPEILRLQCPLVQTLRYGENPDQSAAMYRESAFGGPSVVTAKSVAGKPLSYNNLMDAAAALELVLDIHQSTRQPSVAIIKHANPCGASVAKSLQEAFTNAWKCDPLAAFGGIVSLSGEVDENLAEIITDGEKFLEVIVAPSFTPDALSTLNVRWKNIRLLEVGTHDRQKSWQQIRSIEGGYLVQELRPVQAAPSTWEHVAGPTPTEQQLENGALAWITCSYLKSNSISIVDQQSLIGGGMGQVDRVSAARLAIQRAGDRLLQSECAVAGSDAFFPFSDAPQLLIDAGVTCIVQPGGSVRDQETIDVCNANNVTLLHTGTRRFRH